MKRTMFKEVVRVTLLAAAVAAWAGTTLAATVALKQTVAKDFDKNGTFVGYGAGTYYPSSWSFYNGHGYWDSVEDQLCAGNDYVVPKGKLFRVPQASSAIGAFPGDSLTIQAGGQLAIYNRGRAVIDWGSGTGLLIQSTKDVNNFIGGGKDGKRADWQSHFEGKVTFDVSGELKFNPVNNLNVGFTFWGPVYSRADTRIRVMGSYTYTDKRSKFFLTEFLGDTSGFLGPVTVASNAVLAVGASGLTNPGNAVTLESCVYPGQEDHAAAIRAAAWSNACDVTSIAFGANTGLEVVVDPATGTNGLLRVTGALSVTRPVYVYFSERVTNTADYVVSRHPVLKRGAGASGALNADDFVFGGYVDDRLPLTDSVTLSVEEDPLTHEKTLFASGMVPMVTVTKSSGGGNTSTEAYFCQVTNAASWSDGKLPHGDAHYYSDVNYLRFPYATTTDYEFPGLSLTIAKTRCLTEIYKSFTVADLYLMDTSWLYLWGSITKSTLKGRLHISPDNDSGSVEFRFLHNRNLTIESEMDGAGTLRLYGYSGSAVPYGTAELTALNTNFLGKIDVYLVKGTHSTAGAFPTLDKMFMTLYATNQYNLGGALDTFTFDALQLRNMSRLYTKGSFTIGSALNRGIYIDWVGRLYVDTGHTLGIETDITYNGLLRKEGPGLLALGGTPRFGTNGDAAAAPEANSNLLEVVAGSFKPLSATCLDGVDATFDAGTSLVYDLVPADPTLAEKGVTQSKVGSSISFADASVPVSFDAGGAPFSGEAYSVGLFTGTAAQCEALKEKFSFASPAKGYAVRTTVTGEGPCTLVATVAYLGMTVIFR